MKHYDCEICRHLNHASKLHCSTCGTIPAAYSIIGTTAVERGSEFIPIAAARGVERIESRRAHKVYFRTVKLDYYAS